MRLIDMNSITSQTLYNTTIQRCEKEYVNCEKGRVKKVQYKINDYENISDNVQYSNKLLYFVDFKDILDELLRLIVSSGEVDNVSVIMFVVKRDSIMFICVATVELNTEEPLNEKDIQFIEGTLKLYICESLFPGDKTVCKDIVDNITK